MKSFKIALALLTLLSFYSCDFFFVEEDGDPLNTTTKRYVDFDHETSTGKIVRYYETGEKKSVSFYKRGYRDSLFRSWYDDGQLKLQIWYKNGKKDGFYQNYRKGGEIYREIEYVDDMKNGSYTEYWKNGKVKYRMDYENDQPIASSLVEYSSSGKTDSKFLVIKEKNTVALDNMYRLYVYFADLPKEAYYTARIDGIPFILEMKGNKGVIELEVPKGNLIMKKVEFEGYYRGKKRTEQVVTRKFNIGVENS